MGLSYAELDSEVHAAHANRNDFTAADRVIAINLSQTRIARMYEWNELQAIDTGTIGDLATPTLNKFEAVPDNIRKMYSFKIVDTASKSNSRKLRWVTPRKWDEEVPETEAWSVDTPVIYTIWKRAGVNNFEFWKIPDQSYTYEIRSVKWPTDFTTASGVTESDLDHKDDMIIALSASWGFLRKREMEEANRWWGIYREMMNNAIGQDVEEYEIDIRPGIEAGHRSGTPWADPFNRSGVE